MHFKILIKKSILLSIFGIFYFTFLGNTHFASASISPSDLNENGIQDADEAEVILSSDASLPAGEYVFNNLIITNNATLSLLGNPLSPNTFKGVKITVTNLTVDPGSSISADYKGYGLNQGPGASPLLFVGASYGGISVSGNMASIYGSATAPTDLGSGGNSYGGGAIYIVVSNTFTNNGVVSANGNISSSGGSIYVTVNNLAGSGILRANGGGLYASGYFKSPGGGGRIAVYYHASSFSGAIEAKGGCGSYDGYSPSCGQNGTVGIFDKSTNNLYVNSSWQFRGNDNPFVFNDIYISNGAKVASESGANITANNILVDDFSVFTLSGDETINTDNLSVTGNSTISVIPEHTLTLTIPNITIDSGSTISADAKGYLIGPGSPEIYSEAGASYGGRGGGASAKPVYGSAETPVDFGSGTAEGRRGGGAIRLIVDNVLKNNGVISANASFQHTSGGSVYITANKINGEGAFEANGGDAPWPNGTIGGGGGRVAIYFQESSFTGAATVLAGVYCFYGCIPAAQNGTVIMESIVPPCATDCFSNVLFLPGIEASRLYNGDNQLWEPNRNLDVEKLYLNKDGTSINPNIYTKDIIEETNTPVSLGFAGQNIYKSFADTMGELMDDFKIAAWQPFPYDWRQSPEEVVNTPQKLPGGETVSLVDKLQSLVDSSKNGKVTIVAHSKGGLVAKALLKKLQDDKDAGINNLIDSVDVLILVAAPQIGTAQAVPAILHGFDQDIAGGVIMDETHARELGRNMKGAFSLLPSREYVNRVSASLITFKDTLIPSNVTTKFVQTFGSAIDSYTEYKDFLFGREGRIDPSQNKTNLPISLSENLFSQAESLHDNIDFWIPPSTLRVIEVAGWGLDTVASFEYYPKEDCGGSSCKFVLDERPRFTSDGDGTVVVPSAQYMSLDGAEKYWVDLPEHNAELGRFRRNREHKDILEVNELNNLIQSILEKTQITLGNVLKDVSPIDTSNRLRLSIHSPVTLDAYDADGNHTGKICPPSSEFCYAEENILNSSYLEFGEGKYINLPEDQMKSVKLQGTDVGTFTYSSERVLPDGTSNTSSFIDIPVTTQTQAEITLNPSTQTPQLALDVTGDGVTDFTIQPNNEFDPVLYLKIMKETINSFDLQKAKKNALNKRIDNIIKAIQKGKINKAELKAEKFKSVLEKKLAKPDSKKPKPKKLSKTDAQLLLDMLNKLLDNIK